MYRYGRWTDAKFWGEKLAGRFREAQEKCSAFFSDYLFLSFLCWYSSTPDFSCVLDDSNLHYVGEKWVMRVKQERCFPPLNFKHSWIPLLHVVLVSCCQVRVKGDEMTATVIVFTVQLWRWSCGCWWHQYTCQFKKYGYRAAWFQLFCSQQFHQYLLLILCFACSATPWTRNTFYFPAECKWQMKSSMYQQGWRVDCIIFDYEFNGSSPP